MAARSFQTFAIVLAVAALLLLGAAPVSAAPPVRDDAMAMCGHHRPAKPFQSDRQVVCAACSLNSALLAAAPFMPERPVDYVVARTTPAPADLRPGIEHAPDAPPPRQASC